MRKVYIPFILMIFYATLFSQSWHKADQPEGGSIEFIDASPLDTNKIVIMVRNYLDGVVYYSENGGLSWVKIGVSSSPGPVRIDIENNRIYAAGFNLVQVTTDYGRTWDTLLTETGFVRDLKYNPHKPSEVLALSYYGVHRSSDFGLTWDLVYEANNNSFRSISYSPHNSEHVIIKSQWGSINSRDAGRSWEWVAIRYSANTSPILYDPLNEGILYTTSEDYGYGYMLWSTDSGISWEIKNSNTKEPGICYQENNEIIFISSRGKGIFKSSDFGFTWTLISPRLATDYCHFSGKKLYVSFTSTGFAVYEGNSSWSTRNKGVRENIAYSIAVKDSLKLFSSFNNTFRKRGTGPEAEWKSVRPDSAIFNLVLLDSLTGFGTDRRNTVFKTTDGGENWFFFSKFPWYNWYFEIRHLKIINDWLFAAVTGSEDAEGGIYRTPLSQASWAIKLSGSNYRVIYDGTMLYGFHSSNLSKLLKSSDLGSSWYEVGNLTPDLVYSSFAKTEDPAGILIGGRGTGPSSLSSGVMYFIDPEDNIKKIYEGDAITDIVTPAGRKEIFIIKTSQSIILKSDSIGGAFYPYEEGLPYIIYGQGGGNLFYFDIPGYSNKIFTNRGGLMELELNTLVPADPDAFIPEFSLSQNYPNPFNPSTRIRFSIQRSENVSLIIYDILGSEIIRLIDNELNSGSYEVEFNGGGVSSGIYFYRLTAGEFSEIRKMMFIK
jgi:photosystem II stability/assembly factor-like uncharacterized protein